MRYNTENCALELSVDELCAMAHKSGDLGIRRPRGHRFLGADRACEYRGEGVLLRNTTLRSGITYTVEGVADAVC